MYLNYQPSCDFIVWMICEYICSPHLFYENKNYSLFVEICWNLSKRSDATLFILSIHMSVKEGEAISFVATASKLAAVEDAAPKGPEASIRSKVSPTARAALQALRTPRNRISSPLTPSPPITKDVETITGKFFSFILSRYNI